MKKSKPQNVAAYIAATPVETRARLKALRKAIKQAAPKAEEKLSYQMPYYGYLGRLAYFAVWKKHIGLYIPPPAVAEHKRELKKYVTNRATVQFPHDKPLPIALIKKLVKSRVKWNEAKKKK